MIFLENDYKCILQRWQVSEDEMALRPHIQALRGLWRGLRGNLAWAGQERDPQGIPAELLPAAKREQL